MVGLRAAGDSDRDILGAASTSVTRISARVQPEPVSSSR
jgi:hypothetical protein